MGALDKFRESSGIGAVQITAKHPIRIVPVESASIPARTISDYGADQFGRLQAAETCSRSCGFEAFRQAFPNRRAAIGVLPTRTRLRVRRGRREHALSICLFGDYSTSCALFGCRDVPVNWTLRRVQNFGEAQRVRMNKWEIS